MPVVGSSPNKSVTRTVDGQTGSTSWQDLDAAKVGILSADHDEHDQDIVDALNVMMMKDGGTAATADLPMGTNKLTNLGSGTARTHSANVGQIQNGAFHYAASSGDDTITASLSPAITAYAAGQKFIIKAGGTNTGAATINFNSVGAESIKKGPDGASDLAAGDIAADGMYALLYDGANFQLLNPGTQNITITAAGANLLDDASESAQRTTLGLAIGTDVLGVAANLSDVASAATAFGNIKQNASTSATGVIEIATAAEMETASSTSLAVTPGVQQRHPGHPKFWADVPVSGGTPSISASYNVTSITDTALGRLTVTIATDFSSANWACFVTTVSVGVLNGTEESGSKAAGSVILKCNDENETPADPSGWNVAGFGDQS